MRKSMALAMALCFAGGCAYPGPIRIIGSGEEVKRILGKPVSIAAPLAEIPIGETLEYQVYFFGTPVATATMTTSRPSDPKYAGLVELKFESHAHWFLRALYPVQTILVSWVDPRTVISRRSESYIRKRWRLYQDIITFDQERGLALHKISNQKSITVPIHPNVHDSLGMVYYARTLPIVPGQSFPIQVTSDGKVWQLTAQALQACIVEVERAVYRPAVEVEMELAYPVPFFDGANAQIWFSADSERIPLIVKLKSRMGPVNAVLMKRTLRPPAAAALAPEPSAS